MRLTETKTASGGTIAIRTDITELVNTQIEIRESEERFRILAEGAPIPLGILHNYKFLYANEHMHTMMGKVSGSLIGETLFDLLKNDKDRLELLSAFERDGKIDNIEAHFVSDTGQEIWGSITGLPIVYDGKEALFTSLIDVTNLKNNQRALEQRNAQFEDLLELNPSAILVQVDGVIKYANASAVRIFGAQNTEQLIGLDSLAIVHPDRRQEVFNRRTIILSENVTSAAAPSIHMRLDGTEFYSEVSVGPVSWEGRSGTMNIIADVTDRRETELALDREKERFQDLTNATSDWYWESDKNLQFTYMSSKVAMAGLEQANYYIGKSQRGILGDKKFEEQSSLLELEATMKRQQPFRDIVFWRIKNNSDEKVWMRTSGKPFYNEAGEFQGYRGSSSDISTQRTLQQQLEQAQKMDAVGQLTGGVAHDFNNLLNVIQGNAELLQENLIDGIALKPQQFDSILRATTRGAELTQHMLAFSRKQDLKPQTVQLRNELGSIIDILKRTIGEDILLKLEIDDNLWPCVADLGQVENAILNLALN